MKLYKYLEKRFADSMLAVGNIRLGTLYEYRTMENEQVRDEWEGRFVATSQYDHTRFSAAQPLLGAAQHLVSLSADATPGASAELRQVEVRVPVEVPNRNIYCVTTKASEAVMRSFNCDACIEIIDPNGFIDALRYALYKLHIGNPHDTKAKACQYNGRVADYGTQDAYWLKNPSYQSQKEFRIVIHPYQEKQIVKAEILNIRKIIPFIKVHQF